MDDITFFIILVYNVLFIDLSVNYGHKSKVYKQLLNSKYKAAVTNSKDDLVANYQQSE